MNPHDGSSEKSSQTLIDQLARDLRPVKVSSLRTLTIQYFLTLFGIGVVFFVLLGLIFGIWVGVTPAEFGFSLLTLTLGMGAGSRLLAQYSRPGLIASHGTKKIFFGLLSIAAIMEGVRYAAQIGLPTWGPPIQGGWACLVSVLAIGGVGATVLMLEVRKQAPVNLKSAGFFVFVTAGAMGAMVLQLHCPNENPAHQILWHILLPLFLFSLSARAFSRQALRW